jgi:hypothetical protein
MSEVDGSDPELIAKVKPKITNEMNERLIAPSHRKK